MMNQFQDTSVTPPRVFEVDESITFADVNGIYRFYRDGIDLNWPETFSPYTAPVVPLTLDQLKANQIGIIKGGYANAVIQSVSFTTSFGVTNAFQADQASQSILSISLQRARVAGGVPSGFYWKAADNTKPAFTLADLEGLDAAMFTQGWVAFQHKDNQIDAINAITGPNPSNPSAQTIAAIAAITW